MDEGPAVAVFLKDFDEELQNLVKGLIAKLAVLDNKITVEFYDSILCIEKHRTDKDVIFIWQDNVTERIKQLCDAFFQGYVTKHLIYEVK